MRKGEFIKWISDLGFHRTWGDNEQEYSMFIGEVKGFMTPKLYFIIQELEVRIYYSNTTSNMSYGSNLGFFPLSSIGEFERTMILSVLAKHFDKIPEEFKKYLRDSKIKNILED